jgi:homoserine kinase
VDAGARLGERGPRGAQKGLAEPTEKDVKCEGDEEELAGSCASRCYFSAVKFAPGAQQLPNAADICAPFDLAMRAFAPISIGNFIVGFDVLGAALTAVDDGPFLGDEVEVETNLLADFTFTLAGTHAHKLPGAAATNLAVLADEAFHRVLEERGIAARARHLTLYKNLPVGSGLGSSATSIVATLRALNQFYDAPLTTGELLPLAAMLEGVVSGDPIYDNVAPCLFGGLQLLVPEAEFRATGQRSRALPVPPDWLFVVHYPGIEISTRMAREILPSAWSIVQVIAFGQRLSTFVDALHRADWSAAARLLTDELVEPHRARLVPGFEAGRVAALGAGAVAFGLSGSGPTCIAVVTSIQQAQLVAQAVEAAMPANSERFTRICRIAELTP